MAFHIHDDAAERMLRELQSLTGESLTDVVKTSLAERLDRERKHQRPPRDPYAVMEEVWARLRDVPILDHRTPDEILGYGPDGLPH